MANDIVIIGGGVVGVTVAIVLQLLGYRTRVVCRHWIGDADGSAAPYAKEPRFASQYPAASIFPHSVKIADETWHVRTTLRFFETLYFTGIAGVRKQRHYDVFESPSPSASHAQSMSEYRALPASGEGEAAAPRRADGVATYGWSFLTHFAEMPHYRAFLARLYRQLGGEVDKGAFFDRDRLEKFHAAALVNCGGAWGMHLCGDSVPSRFLKGILVRVHASGIPWNSVTGEVFSYNYYPDTAVYARPHGATADLYFYPRTDGWLLGGTRFESVPLEAAPPAEWESAGPWRGEMWDGPTKRLAREGIAGAEIEIPEPIVAVNREIIRRLTGVDVTEYPLSAMEGYRYRRDPVRLEAEEYRGMSVIHNYGHGGAGVTLSWSSAVKVAELLRRSAGESDSPGEDVIEQLLASLLRQCANY